jgi:hypothetical protein
MTTTSDLEIALRGVIPDDPRIPDLARLLSSALAGHTPTVTDPTILDLAETLQGKTLQTISGNITVSQVDGTGIAIGHGASSTVINVKVSLQGSEQDLSTCLEQAITVYQSHLHETILYEPDLSRPYKSLYAFTLEDASIFFGRSAAIDRLYEQLLKHRLTVFHARSGAGKTSLINAGLVPRLLRKRCMPLSIRTLDDPLNSLKRTLMALVSGAWPDQFAHLSLHQILHLLCGCLKRTNELVIIFDQFEELFTMTSSREQRQPFVADLAECCNDTSLPLRVVLSIRGDYLTDLADFESHLPHIFHHQYRLEPMSRAEAQEAIVEPLRLLRPPIAYDPALLAKLLDDLERGGMALPHLQIICTSLYDGLPAGNDCITIAQYHQQGEAERILGDYLRREVECLGEHAPLARTVLTELVSTTGTRQTRSLSHLHHALIQRSDLHQLEPVLSRLVAARLVQRDEVDGTVWYELAHDYLVGEIRAWVTPEDLAARRGREIIQQGVANWHEHGWYLDAEPLAFVYEQREHLSNLTRDEVELLLRSAVRHQAAVDTWAQIAYHYGMDIQPLLTPLLTAASHRTRAHVITVLAVLGAAALPFLQAALADPAPLVRVQAIAALEQLATDKTCAMLQHDLVYEVAIPAIPSENGETGFYIDRYPVRNVEYQAFLEDMPEQEPPPSWPTRTAPRGFENHPVTGVTWYEAQAYAVWAGKRLPTAVEWVQAAGGEGTRYPWGANFSPDCCNTRESRIGDTTPVDRYGRGSNSPYGVADMAGNVWEWLADPAGPDGSYRQLRGGEWLYSAEFARIDFDLCWRKPDQRQEVIGFRLCVESRRSMIRNRNA